MAILSRTTSQSVPFTLLSEAKQVIRSKSDWVPDGPWVYSTTSTNAPGQTTWSSLVKYKNWRVDTDYKAKRKAGTPLEDLPFEFQLETAETFNFTSHAYPFRVSWEDRQQWRESINTPVVPLAPTTNQRRTVTHALGLDDVVSRLINKAKGEQVNVPVFVAEGRKTSQMVYQRAVTLVNLVRQARRGNIPYFLDNLHITKRPTGRRRIQSERVWNREFARDSSAAASNLWLEYSYGWVPFMSEVRSATNVLMDVLDKPANRLSSVRVAKNGTSNDTINNYEVGGDSITGLVFATLTTTRKDSIRVVWRYTPTSKDLPGRFGLLNPLEVAWELVPFSFVADWFLPIGDYLSQLDVPYRFNHHGGTIGNKTELTYDMRDLRFEQVNNRIDTGAAPSLSKHNITYKVVRVTRTPLATIPSLSLSAFAIEPKLGAKRVISSIALLRQQLTRLAR